MKRIIAFHVYNDFSGSPKALRTVLSGLLAKGYAVDLITSEGGSLDELSEYENCRIIHSRYKFSENKIVTMLRFFIAQIRIFFKALKYRKVQDCVFYINTIMPLGAALAGKLIGKEVVYHYHENAHIKGGMYSILSRLMQSLADRIMCVSAYQSSFLDRTHGVEVIPNALDEAFLAKLTPDTEAAFSRRKVLMLTSLKEYKGVVEFFQLARMNPDLAFDLVVNDTDENIEEFIRKHSIEIPSNLTYFSRQSNVAQFYNSASVSLNLSRKDEIVETFGLTALEAMSAGLPVIVPTVGGIAEMVEDGVNGYKIDVADLDKISAALQQMHSDSELYARLAGGALKRSNEFSLDNTLAKIETALNVR